MPVELLKAMLEELLAFASETFGEETANQLSAKVQELQDKYTQQAQGAAEGAGTDPNAPTAPAQGATAMSESEKKLQAQFAEMQKRVSQMEAEKRFSEYDRFCEDLVRNGNILPAQKSAAVQLLVNGYSPTVYKFSEDTKTGAKTVERSMTDALKVFLSSLKQVSFGEQANGQRVSSQVQTNGTPAQTEEEELHGKVLQFQEEVQKSGKSITYYEAFQAVIKKETN